MTLTQHHRIETADLPWARTDHPGVERKTLKEGIALLRLAANAALPQLDEAVAAEFFVLEGSLRTPEGVLAKESYSVRPSLDSCSADAEGCTLFLRTFSGVQGATEEVNCASADQPWLPGQGGLRVKPLGTSSALVHWPTNERFVPHRHWGGEEIFVLSGTFRDEHGVYPAGTWLQSPHLSAHHPFVEEETVIWVKTGHLHPDAPPM